MARVATKEIGVFKRMSTTRTHNGKPDICYEITYKQDGRKIREKVGYASEGYSAKLAEQVRSERIRTMRHWQELPNKKQKAPLFSEVAQKYNEWVKDNKTRSGYDDINRYKNHLAPRFDSKRMTEITSFALRK